MVVVLPLLVTFRFANSAFEMQGLVSNSKYVSDIVFNHHINVVSLILVIAVCLFEKLLRPSSEETECLTE